MYRRSYGVGSANGSTGNWYIGPDARLRTTPAQSEGKSILVLSSESGQGKSWQLAALAGAETAGEGVVTGAWSKLKAYLRKVANRMPKALDRALARGLARITAANAYGWFKHAGYDPHKQPRNVLVS